MRKSAAAALRLHKWLGLAIGVQMVFWLASGLYMVVVDIDFIHGDPLVKNMQPTLDPDHRPGVSLARLRADYPLASEITLKPLLGQPVYVITTPHERLLVDAQSGATLSPLDEDAARAIAAHHYNGEAPIAAARLLTSAPPMEIRGRALPLWRIDFDDRLATSFYIDPMNGALVTRRHGFWRLFDVMWMLHIMDYRERDEIHHALLWIAQTAGFLLFLSGAWVLAHRLAASARRRKRMRRG